MIDIKCGVFGAVSANNYLVTDTDTGKSVLIDCSASDDEYIRFLGDAKPEYILLTHGHFDHCAGVKAISERYGSKIVIPEGDVQMAKGSKYNLASAFGFDTEAFEPDMTVKEGSIIRFGNTCLKVTEYPGHTPGSVAYTTGRTMFTGDFIMRSTHGRIDFPGGSSTDMRASFAKISALKNDYTLYPGHGEKTTLNNEKPNMAYYAQFLY